MKIPFKDYDIREDKILRAATTEAVAAIATELLMVYPDAPRKAAIEICVTNAIIRATKELWALHEQDARSPSSPAALP